MKIKIYLSDGTEMEQVMNQPVITIGRSSKSDLSVNEESLSRQHCQVEFKDEAFYVTDLNSANGVYLNDERIPPQTAVKVDSHDQLSIGILKVELSKSEEIENIDPAPELELDTGPTKRIKKGTKLTRVLEIESKKSKQNQKVLILLGVGVLILLLLYFFI